MKKTYRLFLFGVVLLLASPLDYSKLMACGLDWKIPKSHFDGVDEQGKLSFWEKIGDLDLGKNVKLPLNIGFESSRNSSSPYLGDGWTLALLEANIVQLDDKRFMMVQPDGWTSRFGRKQASDTMLTGQRGWMASINGNQITVWASCGWKMIFTDGKITSITTPQNQVLDYIYESGIVKGINEDGVPILRVVTDPATGIVSGLAFNNDKKITITESQKPRVQNLGGRNVIGEVKQSLSKLTLADGAIETFKFAVTPAPALLPTLDIIGGNNNRSFSWDPTSNLILRDGDWSYKIVPGQKEFSSSQMTRLNKAGKSEYWFDDAANGQEITQDLNGVKQIKEVFTTGILKGKLRKIEQISPGGSEIDLYTATYDEKGALIRSKDNMGNLFEWKNVEGGRQLLKNGVPLYTYYLDQQNRITKKIFAQTNAIETYAYSDQGVVATTLFANGTELVKTSNLNGIILNQDFKNLVNEAESNLVSQTGGQTK